MRALRPGSTPFLGRAGPGHGSPYVEVANLVSAQSGSGDAQGKPHPLPSGGINGGSRDPMVLPLYDKRLAGTTAVVNAVACRVPGCRTGISHRSPRHHRPPAVPERALALAPPDGRPHHQMPVGRDMFRFTICEAPWPLAQRQ